MDKSSTNGVAYTDATLVAAAVLRASGMSTELAVAEALKLQLCLAHDTWMVGNGGTDERPF
jgi:hypothetical protein